MTRWRTWARWSDWTCVTTKLDLLFVNTWYRCILIYLTPFQIIWISINCVRQPYNSCQSRNWQEKRGTWHYQSYTVYMNYQANHTFYRIIKLRTHCLIPGATLDIAFFKGCTREMISSRVIPVVSKSGDS